MFPEFAGDRGDKSKGHEKKNWNSGSDEKITDTILPFLLFVVHFFFAAAKRILETRDERVNSGTTGNPVACPLHGGSYFLSPPQARCDLIARKILCTDFDR